MGMVMGFTLVTDETIERILADPPLVWLVLAPDDDEAYTRARRDATRRKRSLLDRLLGRSAPPSPEIEPAPFTIADGEGENFDVDKSWHGIHFVLTGSPNEGKTPLDFLLGGGRYVGDEDTGYGPARVFTSTETRRIAEAAGAISDQELEARFDPARMKAAKIYLGEFWGRGTQDPGTLEYLMTNVATLRDVLARAVAKGQGLMITLS